MIGNDIVDLAQATQDSNWQRRGFLAKLFTDYEQAIIREATNPEQLVWLFWSLKESVYKACFRETGHRVFAPQKISCHLDLVTETTVEATITYGREYRATCVIRSQYIASVAWLPAITQQPVIHSEFRMPGVRYGLQHQTVRQEVIDYVSSQLAVMPGSLSIRKDRFGTPFILVGSQKIPLSLSHHGHYGSFALDIDSLSPSPVFL